MENTSLSLSPFNHHWRKMEQGREGEWHLFLSKVRHFIFTAVLNKVCFAFELESSSSPSSEK